jgi:hypothetical protein
MADNKNQQRTKREQGRRIRQAVADGFDETEETAHGEMRTSSKFPALWRAGNVRH